MGELVNYVTSLHQATNRLNEFTSVGKKRGNHSGKMFDYENQFQKSKIYYEKYLT
jgi:hypothetical protein